MKIYHNQLIHSLTQGFKPVWLVFGDEPWQKNNSLSTIKNHAQQQGFSEILRFSADNKFDWQQIIDEYQSLSLFANQRIIEVEFTTVKIGDSGNKTLFALSEIIAQNAALQDVVFIFHGPKLDGASANRKWFKALTQLGCYLPLYDIEAKDLPRWLQNQAKSLNVNLAPELSLLLIELFEGNLPALEQELQKLSLLFGTKLISLSDAEQIVIKQAKFNPFQIIDALLEGNCKKCLTMLDQLQQEGTAAGQVIWVFHKEFNQLYTMLDKLAQGYQLNDLYKEYRIWEKRKSLYQHALTHISLKDIKRAISRLADIDLISKTSSEFNAFILLADLCVTLYHGEITKNFSLNYEYS
ncbi:DNA polymerase III subunit delta [Candidatus Colwellia aromaticivorans]|uniref:DNA polymerase III subunit delta n=1 Tax=Candidatus Colwellia aromaticivorans TaxID=2267621 RepID=UPI000DF14526|nr:DNA polymerase III subunit delta [Candidatus Colwellia aromaticivorans]